MKITELKINEQTSDVAILLSGGRRTMLAKALDVVRDNTNQITYLLLDRKLPELERLNGGVYREKGAFVSEIILS